MTPDGVRDRYRATFGFVPDAIDARLRVAGATGRMDAVAAVETLRDALLINNPLEPRVQQLVHFGQVLALGRDDPARLHAHAALRAGASIADLVGVAETALITAGGPAYNLGTDIIAGLLEIAEVARVAPQP